MSKKGKFVKFLRITPFAIMFLASGKYVLDDFKKLDKDKKVYEQLANNVVNESIIEDEVVDTVSDNTIVYNDVVETEESIIDDELVVYDDLLEDDYKFQNVDFDNLIETNEDTEAWISMNGMEYPIVQGETNEDYLHTDFYGNSSKAGTIFIDSDNLPLDGDELSPITHIYGHHMKNGSMFAKVCKYKDPNYYDEHEFGIIYTPDGYAYKLEVIAGFAFSANDYSFYSVNLDTENDYKEFNDYILNKSTFDSGQELEYGDKVAILYTCSYENNNGRYALVCRIKKEYTNYYQVEEAIKNKKVR